MSALSDLMGKLSVEVTELRQERDGWVDRCDRLKRELATAQARVAELEAAVEAMSNDDFAKLATRFRAAESALKSACKLLMRVDVEDPVWLLAKEAWLREHPE